MSSGDFCIKETRSIHQFCLECKNFKSQYLKMHRETYNSKETMCIDEKKNLLYIIIIKYARGHPEAGYCVIKSIKCLLIITTNALLVIRRDHQVHQDTEETRGPKADK